MIQQITLDFKGKISGSVIENPAVAKMNGIEFTQQQYDNIYNGELICNNNDMIEVTFPIPNTVTGVQYVDIFQTSHVDVGGKIETVCGDYGVFNKSQTYVQKMLRVTITGNQIVITITSFDKFHVYGVKSNVTYDDSALNSYSGNVTWQQTTGTSVTDTIDRKKLNDIITQLQSYPENSVMSASFIRVPVEG